MLVDYTQHYQDALAEDIEEALYALPQGIVDHIVVNVTFGYEARDPTGYDLRTEDVAYMNWEVEMRGSAVSMLPLVSSAIGIRSLCLCLYLVCMLIAVHTTPRYETQCYFHDMPALPN